MQSLKDMENKMFKDYMDNLIGQKIVTAPTIKIKSELTEDELKKTIEDFKKIHNKPTPDNPVPISEQMEEWVWVTGYKGTDKDMKCRDYQYEKGKLHSMPEDAAIKDCKSGFHLCLNLKDVLTYYNIGKGNRYFEVQALVRKRDYDRYGKSDKSASSTLYSIYFDTDPIRDKLAAKSIVFTRELTLTEIFKNTEAAEWPDKFKQMAIEKDLVDARHAMEAEELTELGYSEAFAEYIAQEGSYKAAKKVASQKDLSMDMKVLCILRGM